MIQSLCENCRQLVRQAQQLEQAIPGLNILSSAYGSVCQNTGLCNRHDMLTALNSSCADFEPTQ